MNPLPLAFLLLGAVPLSAGILAHLSISEDGTPLGTLTLDLDPVNAPRATGNFVGLASGALPWLDVPAGTVREGVPYYDGIKFHRVVKGFVSQVGSRNGMGTDGPGYVFPDAPETSNGLTHTGPYVVSMANSGPNTNGSQIFITAATAGHLDGKHIVFGKVAPGASETLADYINNVPVVDADGPDDIPGTSDDNHLPVSDVVIDSVTIDYNGISFDPTAQGLPWLSTVALDSVPPPGAAEAALTQPPGTSAQVVYSSDLASWEFGTQRYLDGTTAPLDSYPLPAAATAEGRGFFRGILATYDSSALWPSSLANRTFVATTAVDPATPFTFQFGPDGITGTWDYPRPTGPLSGNILDSFHQPDGYGGRLILILSDINYNRWDFQRIGFDSASPTTLTCRQNGSATSTNPFAHNPPATGRLSISGTSTLSR